MANYDYAQLGSGCEAENDVLTSNRKFFPLNYPSYNLYYTHMLQYPGKTHDFITSVGHPKKVEDIKTKQISDEVPSEHRHPFRLGEYKQSCCGSQ